MSEIWKRASVILVGLFLMFSSVEARADDNNEKPKSLRGTYTFRLTPAVSFAPFLPTSGVATAPRQDILRVGVFQANGAGGLTGHTIATTDDGLTTIVIDFNWTGTFTLNGDGTGAISINAPTIINSCVDGNSPPNPVVGCAAFEGAETYAFVSNPQGDEKVLELIETDNNGGGAKIFLTGQARRKGGN